MFHILFPLNFISFQDSTVETVILISPKFGVSQISSLRNTVVSIFLNIFQSSQFASEDGVESKKADAFYFSVESKELISENQP